MKNMEKQAKNICAGGSATREADNDQGDVGTGLDTDGSKSEGGQYLSCSNSA